MLWTRLVPLGAALLMTAPALAQSAEHVAAVKAAVEAAPVIAGATNGCPPLAEDFFGWPGKLVKRCEYKSGDLTGVVYVLDLPHETAAKWIETACEEQMPGVAACFARILSCGVKESGMVFPISGNVIAEKSGATQNTFFRNGVALAGAKPGPIPLDEQEKLARQPDAEAVPFGRGPARLWRTLPHQFAIKAIELGVPGELNTPDRRLKWLEAVRDETLATLSQPRNRLLIAWMAAHPIVLRTGECPDDRDP